MEHETQGMEDEPLCAAASSSTDVAKHTEEKGADIDEIVAEAWGEGENNKSVELWGPIKFINFFKGSEIGHFGGLGGPWGL